MENLMVSLEVVFPIFFMLALGYLIQRLHLVDEKVFDGITTLMFQVMLPIHLFLDISGTSVEESFSPKLMALGAGGVLLYALAAMVVIPCLEKDNFKRGAMVQACFRSNFVLFGVPIAQTLYGSAAVGAAAMLIAVIVPMFNVLSVTCLEFFRGGKPNGKKILSGIAKNPLIISSLLGILVLFSGIQVPSILQSGLSQVGSVATPMAIIALGGTFHFSALRGNMKQLCICVGSKLVVMPALFFLAGIMLGMQGLEFSVLLGVSATPVAVSSFPMAQKMGSDGELAGQIVVFTVLLSIVTMFFWVLLLKSFGYL